MSTETKLTHSPPAPVARVSRKKWLLAFSVLGLLGVGGAMLWGREHGANPSHELAQAHEHESASEHSPGEEPAVRVQVAHPERGGLTRTSTQIGSVHPFQGADLFSKVSGYLKWQEVDIGSRVKKGELLAEIDDPEVVKEAERAAAALKQAKAMVAQAKARIDTAKADEKAAEAGVVKARAQIGSYVSRRNYRQKEFARYRDLLRREATTQQIVDEYEDHYETSVAEERTAQAELISTQAQLESMQAKVAQAKADLAEAESNVEVAEATLAKDRVLVDYCKIYSPYDGVITLRNFFVGDFIRSASEGNERPLLTAARTDKMRVVTYIPDRDVPFTDVGDTAIVTLDALPNEKFEGKVSRFANSEEVQSRTMRTEIDLENPKGLLREGMYGIATIILDKDTSNLTIPSSALVGKIENGQSSVYVVRSGRSKEVSVKVGTDDGIRVEILKGLAPTDEVILNHAGVGADVPVVVEKPAKGESA